MQKKTAGLSPRRLQTTPPPLWERVLPAKATLRSIRYTAPNPSRAEPAHTRIDGSPCGSGFYPRKPHRGSARTTRQTLRGQSPLPQGSMAAPVGAGSTREGHAAVLQVQRAKPFAGRARSHRDRWQSPVGAGSTRESHAAVHQIHRAKPFAGRARSHRDRWRPLVGAGSTREGHTAVHPIHRGKPFAGRARSHRDRWRPLWERVLPAKATRRSTRYTAANPSRAEPAPTRTGGSPCGSGFYPRKPRGGLPDTTWRILRGQSPLPQGYLLPREATAPLREQLLG